MTAQLLAQRPTIKILLYTDDPNAITGGDDLFGLGSMIERLKAHAPAFADLSIRWVSRSSDQDHHADNKLNLLMSKEVADTGEPFDEIWFFGLHQANTDKFSLGVFRGGPESELTPDEIDELDKWMKVEDGSGGGVLMTGDHNNPVPPNWIPNKNGRCTDTVVKPELLGLGRALGRCVPRAGELRKWDGQPSSHPDESLNTINKGLQTDREPQQLVPERVNANGEPDPNGQPHPLFFYRDGTFIDIFPDHRHEGALVIPDLSDTAVWPVGPTGQPKPCVVACGTNRRSGEKVCLVAAYDGDHAGVGRIVADSSWHHYLNINLKGFPHPAPPPPSSSDKLGQYYGNLAIWLAPLHKRMQMAQTMLLRLANITLLFEQRGVPLNTGDAGYAVLGRATSDCEIHELLRVLGQTQFGQPGLANRGIENVTNTEKEALGLVIESYQQALIRAEQENVPMGSIERQDVVSQEVTRANVAAAGSTAGAGINVANGVLKVQNTNSDATSPGEKEWTIEIKRDNDPAFAVTLVFKLITQNGIVTGQVVNGVDNQLISTVQGTSTTLPGLDQSFLAIEFDWDNVNVTLFGVVNETADSGSFNGRFKARAMTALRDKTGTVSAMAPGDGDTGSGTGTQT